jgi:hypothetical protein
VSGEALKALFHSARFEKLIRSWSHYFATGLLMVMVISTQQVRADDSDAFEISQAGFQVEDSVLLLTAKIGINLPKYLRIAVDQGFSVPLMFEIEIMQQNNYWPDKKVVSLKQQYRLNYLPMLRSYVVQDSNNAQRYYYDNYQTAVDSLTWIYLYPLLDIDNLSADQSYYARLRYGIDSEILPIPLKSSSLWDNDWELASDWYDWEIIRAEL